MMTFSDFVFWICRQTEFVCAGALDVDLPATQ